MVMDAFTLAKKYYPEYWGKDRLDNLVRLNKLTAEQYKEITGKDRERLRCRRYRKRLRCRRYRTGRRSYGSE